MWMFEISETVLVNRQKEAKKIVNNKKPFLF